MQGGFLQVGPRVRVRSAIQQTDDTAVTLQTVGVAVGDCEMQGRLTELVFGVRVRAGGNQFVKYFGGSLVGMMQRSFPALTA